MHWFACVVGTYCFITQVNYYLTNITQLVLFNHLLANLQHKVYNQVHYNKLSSSHYSSSSSTFNQVLTESKSDFYCGNRLLIYPLKVCLVFNGYCATQRNLYGMPTMSTFYALIKIVTIP